MISLVDTKCFGNTISAITPPSMPENVLFENGVFNPVWVRDDFSLSNYMDVVGSKPYGDEDYMTYNLRKYYWGDMTPYVQSGSCLYIRDAGSSLCTLTQDNTLIIDTTQCTVQYPYDVSNDATDMFCIRLRDDRPVKYNSLQLVFKILDGCKQGQNYYKQAIGFDKGIPDGNKIEMRYYGSCMSDYIYEPFPTDWIEIGGASVSDVISQYGEYVRISVTSKCKVEISKIYFTLKHEE